jgi:endonuclease YncB( thermonuclease family)
MKPIHHAFIISSAFSAGFISHYYMSQNPTESFQAQSIIDGDSLEIDNIWQTKIRLNAIDTPERNKLFYREATDKLKQLCWDKNIILKNTKDGGFGRTAADVYCGGDFINPKMIEAGLAIVSIKHAKNQSLYIVQARARQNCRGIWAHDITKIYDDKKLRGTSYNRQTVAFTNNTDCKIKLASN